MIADQEESGIIESIFDGIVRLTGLDFIFYSELLYSVNLSYDLETLNLSNVSSEVNADEAEEIMLNDNDNSDVIFARLANDIFLPFIFLNNKEIFNTFTKTENSYEDSLNLEQKQTFNDAFDGINGIKENFSTYNEIFSDEALKTNNNSTSINFDILNNIQEILEESELAADLEALTENLLDETYEDQAQLLVAYVKEIYPIIANIVKNSQISDKKTLLIAIRNYFYTLLDAGFKNENLNLQDEIISQDEIADTDELNTNFNDDVTAIKKEEEEETSSRTLMLVMGLERESIQAPMLTQTSQLYEGDLAWRTSQELEIYCSIEALGRISDIFLNSLE